MKPAIYLTNPEEVRRVRANQRHVTVAEARAQRERLRAASERFFAEAQAKHTGVVPVPTEARSNE
jgi:hypothetical protein